MSDNTKVLVEIKDMNVSVNVLTDRGGVVAINPYSAFSHLGTVREVEIEGARPGTKKKIWRWSSEGDTGDATSKKSAIARMLDFVGYEQVSLEATIPPLFEVGS